MELKKKLLIRVDKPYYLPGDVIGGTVSLCLEREVKARSIDIDFLAFEYASVTRGSGKHRRTYVERRDICHQVSSLWWGGEGETLGPCLEEFPFEFTIPGDALRSLYTPFDFLLPESAGEKGIKRKVGGYPHTGTIKYRLNVKLDKPMAVDPKDRTFLDVLPLPVPAHEKSWLEYEDIAASGQVGIFATLLGNTFTPGEVIQGRSEILRQASMEIRSISATLRFKYSYTAHRYTDTLIQKIDYLDYPDVPEAREINGDFSFVVPDACPFSVDGELVKIQWEIDIKVDRPMKWDKHLTIPITLAPRG